MSTKFHMIAYVSQADPHQDIDTLIARIVNVAKRENAKRGITGVLFHVDGKFLQVIEGEEQALRALMENIAEDKRHFNLEYLIDTKTESRGFSQWNMDSFNLDKNDVFDVATLKALTRAFEVSLLPRSDTLIFYYKTLLRKKPTASA